MCDIRLVVLGYALGRSVLLQIVKVEALYPGHAHELVHLVEAEEYALVHRVAGLGNSEGSQRALNMLFALRTIQQRTGKDLGATFLSGTTISNSLTELYLLFKYLSSQRVGASGDQLL